MDIRGVIIRLMFGSCCLSLSLSRHVQRFTEKTSPNQLARMIPLCVDCKLCEVVGAAAATYIIHLIVTVAAAAQPEHSNSGFNKNAKPNRSWIARTHTKQSFHFIFVWRKKIKKYSSAFGSFLCWFCMCRKSKHSHGFWLSFSFSRSLALRSSRTRKNPMHSNPYSYFNMELRLHRHYQINQVIDVQHTQLACYAIFEREKKGISPWMLTADAYTNVVESV